MFVRLLTTYRQTIFFGDFVYTRLRAISPWKEENSFYTPHFAKKALKPAIIISENWPRVVWESLDRCREKHILLCYYCLQHCQSWGLNICLFIHTAKSPVVQLLDELWLKQPSEFHSRWPLLCPGPRLPCIVVLCWVTHQFPIRILWHRCEPVCSKPCHLL